MITPSADELICSVCERPVYSQPRADLTPEKCTTCDWLDRMVKDSREREKLRRRLCI